MTIQNEQIMCELTINRTVLNLQTHCREPDLETRAWPWDTDLLTPPDDPAEDWRVTRLLLLVLPPVCRFCEELLTLEVLFGDVTLEECALFVDVERMVWEVERLCDLPSSNLQRYKHKKLLLQVKLYLSKYFQIMTITIVRNIGQYSTIIYMMNHRKRNH